MQIDKKWTPNAPQETNIELLVQNTRYFEKPSDKRLKNYAQRAASFREEILKWKWPSNDWKPLTLNTPAKNKNKNVMTTPRTFVTSSDDENDTIPTSNTTNKKKKSIKKMRRNNEISKKVCLTLNEFTPKNHFTLHFT